MDIKSKSQAQQRVDQILQFQKELQILESEYIISFDTTQRKSVQNYHTNLIASLSAKFDIDSTSQKKQLSLGMKIASFLGALGLSASVFFLFYQFWGTLAVATQVIILVLTPLTTLAITIYLSHNETTSYFSKIFGLLTFVSFVLNISMLGQIFNIAPSENALLLWAVFALLLAYAINARLLLAFGILSFCAFLSAKIGTWSGIYWVGFGQRPEHFIPLAVILFFISFAKHHRYDGFEVIYRVFGMIVFFLPVLILANWGKISYLPLESDFIEILYQIIGFAMSASLIFFGIKKNLSDVVNGANIFFTIFLYTKFFDWWWDWIPKYIFFFLIGVSALLILYVFKRLRVALLEKDKKVTV
jgi:hypothetical protein